MKLTETTSFSRVKTEMLEKKEEYVKSLQMLLATSQPGLFVIQWIEDKLKLLEEKAMNSAKGGAGTDKEAI